MKKEMRVKKSQEFQAIMKNKKFYASPTMTLYVSPKREEKNRVGISVGKRLGGAVDRNKVKRQVRMMVQKVFSFTEEFDSIILIRPQFKEESYSINENYLLELIKKVKIEK